MFLTLFEIRLSFVFEFFVTFSKFVISENVSPLSMTILILSRISRNFSEIFRINVTKKILKWLLENIKKNQEFFLWSFSNFFRDIWGYFVTFRILLRAF